MKFCILIAFLLCDAAIAKHVRSVEGNHQCEYNGVKYNEGESLPTRHLCLNCTCTKDFVEVNDRQCQVMSCPTTNHLEMGCMPVYSDTECCPVSWNCKNIEQSVKCDERYMKHYKVKACMPQYEGNLECPSRFSCSKTDMKINTTECEFHGRLYKPGESIPTSNPCEICMCRGGFAAGESPEISCIGVECPSLFRPKSNRSCYEVFEPEKCCSIRTVCENDEKPADEATCDYDGKTYHKGQRIYPKENPCLICYCDEHWTGIYGNSCRVHDCNLEKKRNLLQQGCLPIYHESTCCPIEFYCGTPQEGFDNTTTSLVNSADIESENACTFKGVHYKTGQVLDIHHPTNCVTCTCTTPPDFTCIHKRCPGPPNDDYTNCTPRFTPGQCCPTYECPMGSAPAIQCSPIKCPSGCKEVTVDNSCPLCHCEQLLCAPPKCPSHCEIDKETAPGRCPGCSCPNDERLDFICPAENITCPDFCMKVSDSFGCPFCMCGALCSPPKCEPGCEIKRDVGKGECPRCSCPDVPEVEPAATLQCSPVKCPPMCREVTSDSGCPSCECKPVCSPPKCDPGCHLEMNPNPLSCPECVCNDQDVLQRTLCSPVKCGPLCHEAFDGKGCPSCICDPTCSPPHCADGCHLDHDPAISPCPVCVCDIKVGRDKCPNITCGSMCQLKPGSDGCPTCTCDPLCSAPQCGDGCHLEYDRSAGPCPACVCIDPADIPCSPVKCEVGCIESLSLNGCPTCVCNPQCSPPKCDAGCHISYNPITGPCPTCECDLIDNISLTSLQCSMPKCDAGCSVDFTAKPCPSCVCAEITNVQCTPPKCESGCRVDLTAKPCPSCVCDIGPEDTSTVECSPIKCNPGCRVDYSAKPCPACSCTRRFSPRKFLPKLLQCSPPKCDLGCQIDYNAKPCPKCDCSGNSYLSAVMCSPPFCDPGCSVDFDAKPCPVCKCEGSSLGIPDIMCSAPRCDEGCKIDFTTKPCPSCTCESIFTGVQCTPPKCDAGCQIDYSTKPCPSCTCFGGLSQLPNPQCSPPKCDSPGCRIDYSTKPCPACVCSSENIPILQCSPPKCDAGCRVDFSTKPCPSCTCSSLGGVPLLQCSPPKCQDGCVVDASTKPCPSCDCSRRQGIPMVACSPPKCDAGCYIDYSTKPCPSCSCQRQGLTVPLLQCSPPKCDVGCHIDYSMKPCPGCSCDESTGVQCTPPKCEAGCIIDYASKPCPSCSCEVTPLQCSPPNCEPGCTIDYTSKPCPSCSCQPVPQCSMPICSPGCQLDYTTGPCPVCVCDRYQRKFDSMPLNYFYDPFCSTLSCGPGCVKGTTLSSPNQRCPMCVCRGASGESLKNCAPMTCRLPCLWKRISEHACPICSCGRPF